MQSFLYLACPYTHPSERRQERRAEAASLAAARLCAETGRPVFSPISMGHAVRQAARRLGLEVGGTWKDWESLDRAVLESPLCGGLVVLTLPGWDESTGVQAEMAIARRRCLPVEFFDGRSAEDQE